MPDLRRTAPLGLAGVFAVAGAMHFARPAFFDAIMPRVLPTRSHRPLIYASGVVELACAAGLARRTRWAAPLSVAVLAAVFPANVQMALDAGTGRNSGATDRATVAWGRLPLQALMVWAALQARPAPGGPGADSARAGGEGPSDTPTRRAGAQSDQGSGLSGSIR
jgi:uncharacterized membrane protein